MRNKPYLPYFAIIIAIVVALSIPQSFVGGLRSMAVGIISPAWDVLYKAKKIITSPFTRVFKPENAKNPYDLEENSRLVLENQQLREELEKFQIIFQHEQFIEYQISRLSELQAKLFPKADSFVRQRYEELGKLLKYQLQAIPAEVVFREPSAWGSSLWLNVGSDDNTAFDRDVVAKNSPVIFGTSVVGVIDYVGKRQSRVRLITDSGLNPAVRVARGSPQNAVLQEQLDAIIRTLHDNPSGIEMPKSKDLLEKSLERWREMLTKSEETMLLAKGILKGSSAPLWRAGGMVLKGVGFNSDYPDKYDVARDLRSGTPIDTTSAMLTIPILKVGDILVTTGMDGVFPPGLRVATVAKVDMLKEGSYTYDLEALPTAGSLSDISLLYVMPAIRFDDKDQPEF